MRKLTSLKGSCCVGVLLLAACAGSAPVVGRPTTGTPHLAPTFAPPPVAPTAVALEWLRAPASPEYAEAWNSDFSLALLAGPDGVSLWETASGRARGVLGYASKAVFSPSANYIALQRDNQVRLVERASRRVLGTLDCPRRELVALLEAPLRIVTQAYGAGSVADDKPGDLETWSMPGGTRLAKTPCGPVVNVAADGNKAMVGWSVGDTSNISARVVTFPACTELARFTQPDASQLTHAAFSRDGSHAFATLGNEDVNGRPLNRLLLHWQGGAKLAPIASFGSDGGHEFDFDELRVDDTGQFVAFANVEEFVPRTCVNCTYADADSIGYSTKFEDSRSFDAHGHLREAGYDDGFGVAFFAVRERDEHVPAGTREPRFLAPGRSPKPLYAAAKPNWQSRALTLGPRWFSFIRDERTFFFVDLEHGKVLTTANANSRPTSSHVSPDGQHVLLGFGSRKLELRSLTDPQVPRLRELEGFALSDTWLDTETFVVQRSAAPCLPLADCPTVQVLTTLAGRETVVLPAESAAIRTISLHTPIAIPQPPAGLDRDEQRMFVGTVLDKVQLFSDGDSVTMVRIADGARLTLSFAPNSRLAPAAPLWATAAGRFVADPALFDTLTFAPRGQATTGPLLSGKDVASDCLDPELLRHFVGGEPVGCTHEL